MADQHRQYRTAAEADQWSQVRWTEGNPNSNASAVQNSESKFETDSCTEPIDKSAIYTYPSERRRLP